MSLVPFQNFLQITHVIQIKLKILHCLEVSWRWGFLGLQCRRSHQWWALGALMKGGGGETRSPWQICDFFLNFSWRFSEIPTQARPGYLGRDLNRFGKLIPEQKVPTTVGNANDWKTWRKKRGWLSNVVWSYTYIICPHSDFLGKYQHFSGATMVWALWGMVMLPEPPRFKGTAHWLFVHNKSLKPNWPCQSWGSWWGGS